MWFFKTRKGPPTATANAVMNVELLHELFSENQKRKCIGNNVRTSNFRHYNVSCCLFVVDIVLGWVEVMAGGVLHNRIYYTQQKTQDHVTVDINFQFFMGFVRGSSCCQIFNQDYAENSLGCGRTEIGERVDERGSNLRRLYENLCTGSKVKLDTILGNGCTLVRKPFQLLTLEELITICQ